MRRGSVIGRARAARVSRGHAARKDLLIGLHDAGLD